jgi:hypothetical protein
MVTEAAVFGIDDPVLGQRVAAVVELSREADSDAMGKVYRAALRANMLTLEGNMSDRARLGLQRLRMKALASIPSVRRECVEQVPPPPCVAGVGLKSRMPPKIGDAVREVDRRPPDDAIGPIGGAARDGLRQRRDHVG